MEDDSQEKLRKSLDYLKKLEKNIQLGRFRIDSSEELDFSILTDNGAGFIFSSNGNSLFSTKGTSTEVVGLNLNTKSLVKNVPAKMIRAINGDIILDAGRGDIILQAKNVKIFATDASGGQIVLDSTKMVYANSPNVKLTGDYFNGAFSAHTGLAGATGSNHAEINHETTTSTDADRSSFLGRILSAIKQFKKFFEPPCGWYLMAESQIVRCEEILCGSVPSSLGLIPKILPGTATINGPLISGVSIKEIPLANAMFGPGINPGYQASLASIGRTQIIGNLQVDALSNFTGITNKFGLTAKFAASLKQGVDIKNALNLGNGPAVFNGALVANGGIKTPVIISEVCKADMGMFKAVAAPFKQFNIKHPTKPNHRLIHACLEGPEYGVYYRGHLTNQNKITLPDYWDNLIDIETITVHFTPHKMYQELYVKSIEWGKVINIVNNNGGPIDCDYVVYAERKDIEKLKVEVEDES